MITAVRAAEVAALLRRASRAEILPRFRKLAQGEVRAKSGPLDLVTDADEGAERIIEAGLRRLFPGCVVVGEEAAAADGSVLDRLRDAELAFVVDPVDGTANFAAGLPLFGCMAAAVVKGEVAAGWIHDPLGDDTAIALRGEGAWIADADGRATTDLRVGGAAPLDRMLAAISWTYLPQNLKGQVTARFPLFAGVVSYRCAAHEYRWVAGGYGQVLFYNRLMPWDHLPGWLLHREAGGYSARFDGSDYLPTHREGGLICAPDRESWDAVRHALLDP
ncbi:inositol monophosphatase [Roseomonas sp. HJA6]|uniref:Inositol monophosphatase n=1 Tax=Roseomonas alba TaxID=2846776 RepID=A0ABS7A874_9PROT|nr:inositol monophosphatase family protein [Neoroseomonas alba]MBW6397520.1 inositol monophosphatase [Neoroseomonas alba]